MKRKIFLYIKDMIELLLKEERKEGVKDETICADSKAT